MDATVEIGRNPVDKPRFIVSVENEGTGQLNPSREINFLGANGHGGILIFPVQLTTSRTGKFTRLIYTLLYVMTIHTYIHRV